MKLVFILAAIAIFGVLIAVHEFGHFITAKLCGVRVNEFSIGMGPCIWSRTKGETQYSLRILPVGGYCALEGEDEDSEDERGLNRQSFWKKFLILASGSGMNFIFGIAIIFALYAGAAGFYVDAIAGVAPEVAAEDGLQAGDLIYKVNGYRTYLQGDAALFLQYADDSVDIEVLRDGTHIRMEDMRRQTCTGTDGTLYEGFGLYIGARFVPAGFFTKLQYTWYQAIDFVQMVWFSLIQLFTGNAGMQDIAGPVGIVSTMTEMGTSAETSAAAWMNVFYFAALLAVNLAVMNLLPIPALDGGRIFFLVLESTVWLLFRKKIPEKYQSAINTAGFAVLMAFMLIVTFHDIFRLVQ